MAFGDAVRRLLGMADPQDQERQEFVRGCADMGSARLERYRIYEDLYDGRLGPPLDERQRQYLSSLAGVQFSENFCAPVVDRKAHRLAVRALRVKENKAAEEYLNGIFWTRNRMGRVQGVVHTETLKKGDGFVIVSWDNARGIPVAQFNRPELLKPIYDEETGAMILVPKLWSTSKRSASNPSGRLILRLNLYYEDRIEKWFCVSKADENAAWVPFREREGDTWPTWWTDDDTEDGDPLGIPVGHFRNRPGDRWFGRSELRAAIPFKRELDKWILDLFDVMDEQGAKQRWAAGLDETTRSLVVRRGEWIKGPTGATFGELTAEDPERLHSAIRETLVRMSAATATAFQELTKGDPPSGESRKTFESAEVATCKDFIVSASDSWEDVARVAWRLADTFGADAPPFDPDAEITVDWDGVETRDDVTESTVALADQQLGASRRTLLRRRGYDPDEEARWVAEEEAAAARRARADAPPPPA